MDIIISILTLLIAACTLIFSIHMYNQTYLIPKKSESIHNLINIIADKIYEIKVEKKESGNIAALEYLIYTTDNENGRIDLYEKWKIILEDFRYSSDYKFLIDSAKEEFDELLSEDFYKQIKSSQDFVVELEAKRKRLLKLNEDICNSLSDGIIVRFLNWLL